MSGSSAPLYDIQVTVTGLITSRHRFETESGLWGECTFPGFARRATFHWADGRKMELHRTRWFKREHELMVDGAVLGRATQRRLFSQEMTLTFDGQEYSLAPAGLFARKWDLLDAGGTTLLEIAPQGFFRRGAILTICAPLAAELIVLAYYVYHVCQEEAAAGATAAAS